MAISLKHKFVSSIPDDGDTTRVRPSNWNDEHSITMSTARILGRVGAGDGPVQELSSSDVLTIVNAVNKAGDSMTGQLLLAANPIAALGAVPKQYVDALAASAITFSPAGGLTGPSVQQAIEQVNSSSIAATRLTGTVPDAQLPSRLRAVVPAYITNANDAVDSGVYVMRPATANMPSAGLYAHLWVVRYDDATVFQMALQAGAIGSPPMVWQRARSVASSWGSWRRWMPDLSELDQRFLKRDAGADPLVGQLITSATQAFLGLVPNNNNNQRVELACRDSGGHLALWAGGDHLRVYRNGDVSIDNGTLWLGGKRAIHDQISPIPRLSWAGQLTSSGNEPYVGGVVSCARPSGVNDYRYLQARGPDGNYYTCSYV